MNDGRQSRFAPGPAEGSRSRNATSSFPRVPPPPPGLRARTRRPPPASLREASRGDPARPGLRKWRVRRPPRPKGGRTRGESRRPGPGHPAPQPPAARLPARSPPSWRRPCRRSAPPAPPVALAAAAALGPPFRSRLGLASHARSACSLARPPVRFPVAAAHAHWLAGWREAEGWAAARAFSLAGCTRCGERRGAAERG